MFDMKMDLHTHPPANTTTQFPSQGASYQSMMLPKQQHQNLNPTGGGGGGAYKPTSVSKNYSSGTKCRIDLRPGCKLTNSDHERTLAGPFL